MKNKFLFLLATLMILMSISLYPMSAAYGKTPKSVIITARVLNVRTSPLGKIISRVRKNEVKTVLATKKDSRGNLWYKIDKGYISAAYTIPVNRGGGVKKTAPSVQKQTMGTEFLTLLNQKRKEKGLAPLIYNASLERAAALRSSEAYVKFSHTRPNGSSCFTVRSQLGTRKINAEVLAKGYKNASSVLTAWLASPSHRAALMSKNYKYIGLSFYVSPAGKYYICALFGK